MKFYDKVVWTELCRLWLEIALSDTIHLIVLGRNWSELKARNYHKHHRYITDNSSSFCFRARSLIDLSCRQLCDQSLFYESFGDSRQKSAEKKGSSGLSKHYLTRQQLQSSKVKQTKAISKISEKKLQYKSFFCRLSSSNWTRTAVTLGFMIVASPLCKVVCFLKGDCCSSHKKQSKLTDYH